MNYRENETPHTTVKFASSLPQKLWGVCSVASPLEQDYLYIINKAHEKK